MIQADRYASEAAALLELSQQMEIPYKAGSSAFQVSGSQVTGGLDCQGLCEYLLSRCGCKKNWRGSNDMWRNALSWRGTVEGCIQKFGAIPAGAWLFIWTDETPPPARYQDDLGNATHVGVYIGEGAAVHASASRGRVTVSTIGKKSIRGGWNYVGLCNLLDFGTNTEKNETGDDSPLTAYKTAVVVAPSGKNVNLRVTPSKAGALVDRVPVGENVTVLSTDGLWSKVQYDHMVGYMMAEFLQMEDDTEDITALAPEDAPEDSAAETDVLQRLSDLEEWKAACQRAGRIL